MATVVLRDETLTGSGNISGRTVATFYGDNVQPPEDPQHSGSTSGSVSVTGGGSLTWASWTDNTGTTPGAYTYKVGFTVTVTDPLGNSSTSSDGTTFTATSKIQPDVSGTGTWSISIDAELCLDVTKPTIPSGTGAGGYMPDPPTGYTYRVYYRRKNGGNWSISASCGAASASRSGTFSSSTEIGWPDIINSSTTATATQLYDDTTLTITGETTGTWRGATIATEISSSGSHGDAYANNTNGVKAVAKCLSDPIADSGTASASRNLAVPLTYNLGAALRAMEDAYPETMTLRYERALTTVDATLTSGSYSEVRTYRDEDSSTSVIGNGTTEDSDTYDYPNDFGPIQLDLKTSSMEAYDEPTGDAGFLFKDKKINALSIETPEKSGDLTGSDSALTYGVERTWSPWQGLMGWRYLEVIIAETGGASAGAAVTIKIGSKEWTKDRNGSSLTAPGSGNSATWEIDLCSPTNETSSTDANDTTYPYAQDWTADGGTEDSYPRAGNGPYTGVLSATSIRIEVGTSRTFTITSIKGKRTVADTVYSTNLPTYNRWVQQRPDTVVSASNTTTYHYIRQSYEVDLEGRLIAAEWSDTQWDKTIAGATGIITHSLYEQTIEWLAGRINAAKLCPGWSATIVAPASGTGTAAWYNREREMHGILGGGYFWVPPAGATPGYWASGIDAEQRTNAGGALNLPWQGGFTRLTQCPGNVGDIFFHDAGATTGTLYLKLAKIMRHQGVGLALTTAGLSSSGSTLTLEQAASSRGTGTSASNGYAQTGLSYGRGNGGDITLRFDTGNTGSYPGRPRKRAHFRAKPVTSAGDGIVLALSPSLRLTRGYIQTGTLWLGYSAYPVAQAWEDLDTGLATTRAWINYTTTNDTTALVVTYESSGAIKRLTTLDEGRSSTVATTIFTTGTRPTFCISPSGVEYHFAFVSGSSSIKTRVLDPQGNELIAETTVVASGVSDSSIHAEWREGYVVLLYSTSGGIVTRRSNDGTTYN